MWHYIHPTKEQLLKKMQAAEYMLTQYSDDPVSLRLKAHENGKSFFYSRTGEVCWGRDGAYYQVDVQLRLRKPMLVILRAESRRLAAEGRFQEGDPFDWDIDIPALQTLIRRTMHIPDDDRPMNPVLRSMAKMTAKNREEYAAKVLPDPRKLSAPLRFRRMPVTPEQLEMLQKILPMHSRMGKIMKPVYERQDPQVREQVFGIANYVEDLTVQSIDAQNGMILLQHCRELQKDGWHSVPKQRPRYTLIIDGETCEFTVEHPPMALEKVPLWFCTKTGYLQETVCEIINAALSAYVIPARHLMYDPMNGGFAACTSPLEETQYKALLGLEHADIRASFTFLREELPQTGFTRVTAAEIGTDWLASLPVTGCTGKPMSFPKDRILLRHDASGALLIDCGGWGRFPPKYAMLLDGRVYDFSRDGTDCEGSGWFYRVDSAAPEGGVPCLTEGIVFDASEDAEEILAQFALLYAARVFCAAADSPPTATRRLTVYFTK